jgi:hypothetical protein
MTYEYHCDLCNTYRDVEKPVAEASSQECCPVCTVEMTRIYSIGLNFATLTPKEKDDLIKYRYETGNNLVCVGDDRKALQKIAPQMSTYDLPKDVEARFEN